MTVTTMHTSRHPYTRPRTTRKDVLLVSVRRSVALIALFAAVCVPTVALAAPAASAEETRAYDLDFTLPTAGVSGCTVCHGDPNLVRVGEVTTRSLFVDSEMLAGSAHEGIACTGCHLDFAYKTPHDNLVAGDEWRNVAKQACKNCHENEFTAYTSGVHSPAVRPGEDIALKNAARVAEGKPIDKPMCGDCHGSHNIPRMDDAQAMAEFRADAMRVCGDCHVNEAGSYADYYHGAAYQRGAADAPNCWDCHGDHKVMPADDRASLVHETQLPLTCSAEDACHTNVSEDFMAYAPMIHRKSEIQATVPLWTLIDSVRGVFQTIGSWFS